MKPEDIAPETLIIGGKAMAKLIDAIADLYCTGPDRKLDALGDVALAIERANMVVKYKSDTRTRNFDDRQLLSDVVDWLQETDGVFHVVFRDGYECKHEGDAEEVEEVA